MTSLKETGRCQLREPRASSPRTSQWPVPMQEATLGRREDPVGTLGDTYVLCLFLEFYKRDELFLY